MEGRREKFGEVLEGMERSDGNGILHSKNNEMKEYGLYGVSEVIGCLFVVQNNRGSSICEVFTSGDGQAITM
jgi:hypothetical protein